MILRNATKDKTLSTDLKEVVSLWDKSFGLLDPHNPRTLLFKTRFGLHTFFLKTTIDVLVINNESRVVKLKSDLAPWRFFFYKPIYKSVFELPAGTLKRTSTKINDKILYT